MARRTIREKKEERIDPETGEVVKTTNVIILDNRAGDINFIKVFRAFTDSVIRDLEIENGKAKLLIWFMGQIQDLKPNQIPMIVAPVYQIANELKCSEVGIRKWLAFLIAKKYIKRHEIAGHMVQNTYIVNPDFLLKGTLDKVKR